MTQVNIRGYRINPTELEELLQQVFNSQTYHADPLVKKLVWALEDYQLRDEEGDLDEPAWKKRELELRNALEVVVQERDAMCNWAFGAAIDRLDEGLAVLELPNGPRTAADFSGPWAWREFAISHMHDLRKQFLDGVGEAAAKAMTAVRTEMPHSPQAAAVRPNAIGKRIRMSAQMENARQLLIEAAGQGRPLSDAQLEVRLRAKGADPATAKRMPCTLKARGLIMVDQDGLLTWTDPT